MRTIGCILLVVLSATAIFSQRAADKVIVSDERYIISYQVTAKEIVFTMEDLRVRDGGEANNDKLPFSYFGIMVDINRNGIIDSKVDVAFGLMKNNLSLCTQYLLGPNAATGCGYFVSAAYYEKSSRRTDRARFGHVVHRITIPRYDIAKRGQKTLNVIFHCSSEGDNFFAANSYYPALDGNGTPQSFARTMVLKL